MSLHAIIEYAQIAQFTVLFGVSDARPGATMVIAGVQPCHFLDARTCRPVARSAREPHADSAPSRSNSSSSISTISPSSGRSLMTDVGTQALQHHAAPARAKRLQIRKHTRSLSAFGTYGTWSSDGFTVRAQAAEWT